MLLLFQTLHVLVMYLKNYRHYFINTCNVIINENVTVRGV